MATSYKRHRSRKPLDLKTCKLRMVDAIKALEKIIMTAEDDYKIIQATNALSGIISRYSKLIEVADLEERLKALEKRMDIENPKMKAIK